VLHGEEWYLVPESEVRSLENIKASWEADRLNWLSRVQRLQTESSELRSISESLNDQLSAERQTTKNLTASFNAYEADQSRRMSRKDTELAAKDRELAGQRLETEKYKGKSGTRLIVIIALATAWIAFIAFKVCRFPRIIPA
jgi:transposase